MQVNIRMKRIVDKVIRETYHLVQEQYHYCCQLKSAVLRSCKFLNYKWGGKEGSIGVIGKRLKGKRDKVQGVMLEKIC